MDDNSAISIKDLIQLYLQHLWVLIISLIIGGCGAYAYTHFAVAPEYSSHISMYVQTYLDINDTQNSYNDISKSKQLINTYIQVLKDDAVMESVGKAISKQFDSSVISESFALTDGNIKPASLASCLTINSVTDTSAITITATTKNAEVSAAVCNELCKQANVFAQKAIGVGEIKSIDVAKVYPNPVSPNKTKNAALGGIALMMISALVIFMIDFFDNTIKNSETLSKRFGKAILGEIDEIPDSKSKKGDDEHFTLLRNDIPFNVVESCKSLRTNISFAVSTSEKKSFIVSSANPDEGKSTTAANIAITMADEGQKVLLIDADMRKPVQHKLFGVKNEKGISSVLSKMKKLDECIQKTSKDNLSILTSGPIPPNPSELLSSAITSEIMEELGSRYDIIIIDSPPVNVVSDTLNLSRNVAGLLTVVRCGVTTDEDIKNLVAKAEMAHMELLGFVLNRIKRKSGLGYGKYGKYGKYNYYSDDSKIYKVNAEQKG